MSIWTDWKGTVVFALSLAVLGLAACGGGGATSTSGLSKRAFVSNDEDGTLNIENAADDMASASRIATGNRPGTMVLSRDKSITLVFDAGDLSLAVVSNAKESVLGRIGLPNVSTGYVSLSNNTVGFVAVPNCPSNSCGGFSNIVDVVNLATTFNVTGTINTNVAPGNSTAPLNAATTLVLSPAETRLLVFGGPGDHVDTLTVIDTTAAQTVPPPSTAATQIDSSTCAPASLPANCFDRPVWGVFSADGNTAYILNCGPECGGTTASVTVLNLTASPPVPTKNIPLPAATVGLLNGNSLFVAGTPSGMPGALAGTLSVLDTTALATPASSVAISDGYHNHMELGSNNKLFVGAGPTCTAGCLTIFDTSKNTAVVDKTTGNVTGIAPINGRNVVYVVEIILSLDTSELRIYDTTTDALTSTQIDVVGKAVDVKYVDH